MTEYARLAAELDRRHRTNQLAAYRPYPKQLEFHAKSLTDRERLLLAANQVGKTYCGAAEVAMHLTGRYPKDWPGKKFSGPIRAWAGSKTGEVTRDNPQRLLVGDPRDKANWGTGLVPQGALERTILRHGIADALDSIVVKHVAGGSSTLGFKSYDQGREKWQGETLDLIWFDEEPPIDIYVEGLTRTNATKGKTLITFTPLLGMSEVVRMFLAHDKLAEEGVSRSTTRMTIDDAEHLSEEERTSIIASYPPHERDARTRGVPALGSGRIFPVSDTQIVVDPFTIPDTWACIGGIDFGWDHPTAAVKLAHDRDTDCVYITAAYRVREQPPLIHSAALKPWGDNMPWAWPHDGLRRDRSGETLSQEYVGHGLEMLPDRAQFEDGGNGVEAGLMMMLERMMSSRLKVFSNLGDWLDEFRLYHRKDGLVVKEFDDLMDATRYALMMLRFADAPRMQVYPKRDMSWVV